MIIYSRPKIHAQILRQNIKKRQWWYVLDIKWVEFTTHTLKNEQFKMLSDLDLERQVSPTKCTWSIFNHINQDIKLIYKDWIVVVSVHFLLKVGLILFCFYAKNIWKMLKFSFEYFLFKQIFFKHWWQKCLKFKILKSKNECIWIKLFF